MERIGSFAVLALLFTQAGWAENWRMQPLQIPTRWAASVGPGNSLPEYPRPQMVRRGWQNLNGLWNFAVTPGDALEPTRYDGTILVPFPLESALSGVQRVLRPDELLWYRRTFIPQRMAKGRRLLLHFGAVDFATTVYVNHVEVGTHTGGYQSFVFDITNAIKSGQNDLVVRVVDPTDAGPNPHGKQALTPREIVYTSSSGIWQTVWLEAVPQTYIENVVTTPDVDQGQIALRVRVNGASTDYSIRAIAMVGRKVIAAEQVNGASTLRIKHPRLWSPDDPFLYDLQVRLLKGDTVVDKVKSYFGLRKIEVKKDPSGTPRIFLNDRYTYNLGVLDQGFWPDGLYTAPTDAALKFDVQAAKAMGFNTIRKHIKIEPERWYYYCDKLGMLVWQDMVPPANGTSEARAEFERETQENLEQLHNHPSITTWVLFNEGLGAYDQGRLAKWIKSLDPSRLLDAHSGPNVIHLSEWERHLDGPTLSKVLGGDDRVLIEELRAAGFDEPGNWVGSDLNDIHVYPDPVMPPAQGDRVRVLGEHGGIGLSIDGHTWNGAPGRGYEDVSQDDMTKTYGRIVENLHILEVQGLSGSIYTQPFDVEGEQNGLMTYDRAIIKIPLTDLARINSSIVPKSANQAAATRGFTIENLDLTPAAERYASLLEEYRKGNRQGAFLRRLSLMALELGDQARATEAGNEFIDQSPQPWSKDVWVYIQAITRTSRDRGFEAFRAQTEQADVALGENAAESIIRNVVGREEIEPYTSAKGRIPDWAAIGKTVSTQYGVLGAEKVYGAEMLYYLDQRDWPRFAKYYELYFATAARRSEYSVSALSYALFEHVEDVGALEAAIRVCKAGVDAVEVRGPIDPVDLDTYANLLYKVGREREAIDWEEEAARLSDGWDTDIAQHLAKMKAGQPTWLAAVTSRSAR